MKSILFLVPKMNGPKGHHIYNTYWDKDINDKIDKNRWKVTTPSVLLLASIAISECYEVEIIDEDFDEVDTGKYYDIVCIYTVTPNAKRAYHYSEKFKRNGSWIVIGGVHAAFMQEEAMQYCNTLIVGEGEYVFRDFLHDFRKKTPKIRYIQEKGQVKLCHSPTPAYKLLSKEQQFLIPMQTARGCTNKCKFCNVNSLYGSRFRYKSYTQIENELDEICKLPYVKKIFVTDDNIFSDINHFNRLINVIKDRKLSWYANTDISFANNEETIISAYESGLRQVLIGFESLDSRNLRKIDKDNFKFKYLNKYKEYIKKIQSNGIGVTGSFIIGQVNDNEDTFKYLAEFIYETKLYSANITVSTPYPGTLLYKEMKRKNAILTYDWDYYTIFQPVMTMNYLTIDVLNQLYLNLIRTVYSKEFTDNKLSYFKNIYKEMRIKK